MGTMVVLRKYSEESDEQCVHRLKTTIEYANPGTKFAVETKEVLAQLRAIGVTVPVHVLEVEEGDGISRWAGGYRR